MKLFLSTDFEGTSGVKRVGARTVKLVDDNLLDLYRIFVTVVTLTRALVDR